MSDLKKIFLFFTNNKTAEDLKQKFFLLISSAENKKEKEKLLRELWEDKVAYSHESTQKSLYEVKQRLGQHIQNNWQSKPILFSKAFLRVASIIILTFSLSLILFNYLKMDTIEIVEHIVPAGKRHQIELPDGTNVHLNAGSILVYPKKFTGPYRTVYLFGEGNFDVFSNKENPFVVKTTQVSIKALGTKFNVLSYTDMENMVVTLEEGLIEVEALRDTSVSFLLNPNEQISYNYINQSFDRLTVNSVNANKWIDGEFYFSNQSLKEILNAIKRTYDVKMDINSSVYSSDLYTFKFHKGEPLQKVLRILELTVGNIKIEIDATRKNIVVKPKK